MAEKEECKVVWFEHPPGINSGCAKCRKILRTGTWAVGLLIGQHKYIVGSNPPVVCCDEEKKVIETFDTEPEAEALAKRVIDQLNREGTTENLVLYEAFPGVSDSMH